MSVVHYTDEKFNLIYRYLLSKGREVAHLFHYPDGWDTSGGLDGFFVQFVQDLCRSNSLAWNAQYPDDTVSLRVPVLSRGAAMDDIPVYKALRGLRYNLIDNGGTHHDLNKCYAVLSNLIDDLGYDIISALPEWDKADTW